MSNPIKKDLEEIIRKLSSVQGPLAVDANSSLGKRKKQLSKVVEAQLKRATTASGFKSQLETFLYLYYPDSAVQYDDQKILPKLAHELKKAGFLDLAFLDSSFESEQDKQAVARLLNDIACSTNILVPSKNPLIQLNYNPATLASLNDASDTDEGKAKKHSGKGRKKTVESTATSSDEATVTAA